MGAPEVEFDITYHSEYGIVPTKIQQITGYPYTEEHLPVLTYQGKEFAGWYYTSTFDEGTDVQVGEYASIDHEHLYAKWISPSVSSVLTNLADEIRVLSGTTEPLGLTEMATNVNDANDEVADQTDLIAQLASALQGKSVPGGGEDVTAETGTYTDLLTDLEAAVDALPDAGSGGGASIGTCTVTLTGANSYGRPYWYAYTALDENGNVKSFNVTNNSETSVTLENVMCNSIIAVQTYYSSYMNITATNITKFQMSSSHFLVLYITAPAGATATATFNDGGFGSN